MKRRSVILTAIISAAITIGILAATVGKPPYAKHKAQFGQCKKNGELEKK